MQDKDGKYVDDYADNYHRSKDDIERTLDGRYSNSRDSYRGYSNDAYPSNGYLKRSDNYDSRSRDDYRSSDRGSYDNDQHLSEEEWILKQKKEQKNLEELTSKEKELQVASKDVNAAQDSLA